MPGQNPLKFLKIIASGHGFPVRADGLGRAFKKMVMS
jgi:hypothetical protein